MAVLVDRLRLKNMASVLRHPVAQNALALYIMQFVSFLLPLAAVGYLTRVLGGEGFGLLFLAQSVAGTVAILVEYGFVLSATREIARHREDRAQVAQIVAGVQGAKGLLSIATVIAMLVVAWGYPAFRLHPELLALAWVGAIVQGIIPIWYFQGMERLRPIAFLDISSRIVANAGIFIWVHDPSHIWRVLALQIGTYAVAAGIALAWMYREVPFRWPRPGEAGAALRLGWSMFLFRGGTCLYTRANALILGHIMLSQVPIFGLADKLYQPVVSLFGPLSQAVFPRVSHMMAHDRKRVTVLTRNIGILLGVSGVVIGSLLALIAPYAVKWFGGPEFHEATGVLRVLAFAIPVIAIATVYGMNWMLPMGLDRQFTAMVLAGGAVNIILAVLLAPRYGALGMAFSVLAAEVVIAVGMVLILRRRGINPFAAPQLGDQETGQDEDSAQHELLK